MRRAAHAADGRAARRMRRRGRAWKSGESTLFTDTRRAGCPGGPGALDDVQITLRGDGAAR